MPQINFINRFINRFIKIEINILFMICENNFIIMSSRNVNENVYSDFGLMYDKHSDTIIITEDSKRILRDQKLTTSKVSWIDSKRTKGSCWGSNITDMTLAIKNRYGKYINTLIIKDTTNFVDVVGECYTKDIIVPLQQSLHLKYGKTATLKDFLSNIYKYMSNLKEYDISERHTDVLNLSRYDSEDGKNTEEKILYGTQAHILPFTSGKNNNKLTFHIRLYTYQSKVMVIVLSKWGPSIQIVEEGTQDLYINIKGKKANFTVESFENKRSRDPTKKQGIVKSFTELDTEEAEYNQITVIQIPLISNKSRSNNYQSKSFKVKTGKHGAAKTLIPKCSGYKGVLVGSSLESMNFSMSLSPPVTRNMSYYDRDEPTYRCVDEAACRIIEKSKPKGMDMGAIGWEYEEGDISFPVFESDNGRDINQIARATKLIYRTTDDNKVTPSDGEDIWAHIQENMSIVSNKKSIHDI